MRNIYQKKTIRYCDECIIETGMNVEALREYYGDNFIVDRRYGDGYTGIGFDNRNPLKDDEWETECGSVPDFDMEIEEDIESWKLQRKLHKWLVDSAIEDLLRGTERLRDFFKDRRVLWEMFERSKVGPFLPMRNFYNYLNNVRVFEFDRFKKEIFPLRPDFFNYMNNQNRNNQNKLNNVNNLNNLNSPKSNLKRK